MQRLYQFKRWMYRTGHPNAMAKWMNGFSALQHSSGLLAPRRAVTMEVRGRRSGRVIACPLVVADYAGERYLVSMLGNDANWVANIRAADSLATLRHGRSEQVRLEDVDVADRAPILRRYLDLAPGARPHVPVDRRAPLEEFARIAERYPVFRIIPVPTTR